MKRRNRCVLPEIPCHITQRGVDRREVFSTDQDRHTYLRLIQENLNDAAVRVLGYCLMSNHVHLVAVPAREDSLSILLRRVHGRYAEYYNARTGRSGHLWQNRFFACMLGPTHLWAALAYVERNPVRDKPGTSPVSLSKSALSANDGAPSLSRDRKRKTKGGPPVPRLRARQTCIAIEWHCPAESQITGCRESPSFLGQSRVSEANQRRSPPRRT